MSRRSFEAWDYSVHTSEITRPRRLRVVGNQLWCEAYADRIAEDLETTQKQSYEQSTVIMPRECFLKNRTPLDLSGHVHKRYYLVQPLVLPV